jgi:hypothetical protein
MLHLNIKLKPYPARTRLHMRWIDNQAAIPVLLPEFQYSLIHCLGEDAARLKKHYIIHVSPIKKPPETSDDLTEAFRKLLTISIYHIKHLKWCQNSVT